MKQLLVLALLLTSVFLAGCTGQKDNSHVDPWEADNHDNNTHFNVNDSANGVDDLAGSIIEDDLDNLLNDFNNSDDEALIDDVEVEENSTQS